MKKVMILAVVFGAGFSLGAFLQEKHAVAASRFVRGDCDNDGFVGGSLTDPLFYLNWAFGGGRNPDCLVACDTNADGSAGRDVTDAVYYLNWAFLLGPPPVAPFPFCGTGTTADEELGCANPPSVCELPHAAIAGFTFVEENAQGYPEYIHDQTGIIFVSLPGGTFNMGSQEDERYRGDHEGPVHEVKLSPFLIGKYEVTQAEWEQVMGLNPSFRRGDNLPVDSVSWDDIQGFETITALTLPTEAQWEYACRAGTQTAFSFGSGESCSDATWDHCLFCDGFDAYMWYCGNNEPLYEVGAKLGNQFGLHDTHGSVWEWCEDVDNETFYSTPEASGLDPLCTSGSLAWVRVRRGGSRADDARNSRSAYRSAHEQDHIARRQGFRAAYWPLP